MKVYFYFILLVTINVTVNASHHAPIPIAGTIIFNYFLNLKRSISPITKPTERIVPIIIKIWSFIYFLNLLIIICAITTNNPTNEKLTAKTIITGIIHGNI
tara:strand:+ start:819 stop:1121 length:303 start_codon:yes stop_codon:yes gene_type:complete